VQFSGIFIARLEDIHTRWREPPLAVRQLVLSVYGALSVKSYIYLTVDTSKWKILPMPRRGDKYASVVINSRVRMWQVPGNKMDSSNLATVFGPNVLRDRRKTDRHQPDGVDAMAQISDVVAVVKDLIDFHAAVFRVRLPL